MNTFSKEQLDEVLGEGPAQTLSVFTVSAVSQTSGIYTTQKVPSR